LSLTVRGEPERVIRCHCHYCQRRTGSVFEVCAWFLEDQIVARTGSPRVFNESENNPGVCDYNFCGRCGTTLYWQLKTYAELYIVAVGCFADASFPPPNFDFYEKYRHAWIDRIESAREYPEHPPFEDLIPKRS
jgi:hypothetical protein